MPELPSLNRATEARSPCSLTATGRRFRPSSPDSTCSTLRRHQPRRSAHPELHELMAVWTTMTVLWMEIPMAAPGTFCRFSATALITVENFPTSGALTYRLCAPISVIQLVATFARKLSLVQTSVDNSRTFSRKHSESCRILISRIFHGPKRTCFFVQGLAKRSCILATSSPGRISAKRSCTLLRNPLTSCVSPLSTAW